MLQSLELGDAGPDEATKGIESLLSPTSQDLSQTSEAPQLQVGLDAAPAQGNEAEQSKELSDMPPSASTQVHAALVLLSWSWQTVCVCVCVCVCLPATLCEPCAQLHASGGHPVHARLCSHSLRTVCPTMHIEAFWSLYQTANWGLLSCSMWISSHRSTPGCCEQGLELDAAGPDEATQGIESLPMSAPQSLGQEEELQAPQLQAAVEAAFEAPQQALQVCCTVHTALVSFPVC